MRTRIVSLVAMSVIALFAVRCGGSTADIGNSSGSSSSSGGSSSSSSSSSGGSSGGVSDAATDGSGGGKDASTDGGDGTTCTPACGQGRLCCKGKCINPDNDPLNCGGCGVACSGQTPYCDGTCKALPCQLGGNACNGGTICCGFNCCDNTQLCCKQDGPVSGAPTCFSPTPQQPTCPQGCAPLCVSDREAKRDITPVDDRQVLEAVSRMPISTWSYKSDPAQVRHLGPMAQDFHAAFGMGTTDKAYDPIDAHGAAFSSVRALYEMVQDQERRIDRLERENRELRAGVCGR